jgi:hypothetical protein
VQDCCISKDVLRTGKVIGTSPKVGIAQLLRPPGLQAIPSVPLTLPLSLTTLPALTLAAVERCLALGPPPPPPALATESKKGGAASVVVATAPAPASLGALVSSAAAGAVSTLSAHPASIEAAMSALISKCRPSFSASIGVYMLEALPASAMPVRPGSSSSTATGL